MSDEVPEDELVRTIHDVVAKVGGTYGVVNLGSFHFDRVPCTRKRLYALARKYSPQWGYDYLKSSYTPSGNRPFQKNHKRGRYNAPSLSRTTKGKP